MPDDKIKFQMPKPPEGYFFRVVLGEGYDRRDSFTVQLRKKTFMGNKFVDSCYASPRDVERSIDGACKTLIARLEKKLEDAAEHKRIKGYEGDFHG